MVDSIITNLYFYYVYICEKSEFILLKLMLIYLGNILMACPVHKGFLIIIFNQHLKCHCEHTESICCET